MSMKFTTITLQYNMCRLGLLAWVCVFVILINFGNLATAGSRDISENLRNSLTITERYTIPIAELSGLTMAINSAKKTRGEISLYAVGDASYEVAHIRINTSLGDAGVQPIIHLYDLQNVISNQHIKDASQWEAIATDGNGTACMLNEIRSELSCFDHSFQNNRGNFTLDVSSLRNLNLTWEEQPNSRGEGMILMKKGHVLILKEKKPSMLIEFGPEGALPMGYDMTTFLNVGDTFTGLNVDKSKLSDRLNQPIPSPTRLVALKTWQFSKHLSKLAKDASEIIVGPDKRVYLLSQESSTLCRLEKTLKPNEDKVTIDHDACWKLPAEIDKAEGMVIDELMNPWIGIDIKDTSKQNLFRLSPISAALE